MIKKLEFIIALRYLCTRNKEGFISIVSAFSLIGIALGVATLIVVMSVMSGYEIQLINRILGINGHLTVNATNGNISNFDKLNKEIKKINHVAYTAPIITGPAMISNQAGQAKGVLVRGIDGRDLELKPAIDTSINEFTAYKNNEGIFIGEAMAREMRLSIGDYVKLIAPKVENLVLGMVPRIKTFKIVGIFDVGMYEYNSNSIFMPLKYAQIFFDHKNSTTELEIVLDNPKNLFLVKQEIDLILPSNLKTTDWSTVNQSLIAALRIERNVMFLILTLIIVIAAFNIISSLILLVQNKKKSIAILRTIGMKKSGILKIFIICGSLIGIIGTALGSLLGILFTINIEKIKQFLESVTGQTIFDPVIYFLTNLPAELSATNTLIIIATALLLSLLATIYPAWKASSVMPAAALRYE